MPICEAVYRVLYEHMPADQAVESAAQSSAR